MEEQGIEEVNIQKVVTGAIIKSVAGTAILFIGLGVGAYFLGLFPGSQTVATASSEAEGEGKPVSWKDGAVLDGGSFVVNLADEGTPRYAKVSYGIVLAEGVEPNEAKERLPIVRDRIMPFLMEKTSKELSTAEGFEMVRKRLTEDAHSSFQGRALRGLITELIVQ